MLQLGYGDPSVAWVNGGWMFLAIVVGVAVAYLVFWITNADRNLSIVPARDRCCRSGRASGVRPR